MIVVLFRQKVVAGLQGATVAVELFTKLFELGAGIAGGAEIIGGTTSCGEGIN